MKKKATNAAPPVVVVVDEEPVNAITECFGDDELPAVVAVDVAIVGGGLYRDWVLDCDDVGTLTSIDEELKEEDGGELPMLD